MKEDLTKNIAYILHLCMQFIAVNKAIHNYVGIIDEYS